MYKRLKMYMSDKHPSDPHDRGWELLERKFLRLEIKEFLLMVLILLLVNNSGQTSGLRRS